MMRFASVALALAAMVCSSACKKKSDPGPTQGVATASAPQAAAQAQPPASTPSTARPASTPDAEVPISTASEAARKEFVRGRERLENAQAEDARIAFRAAIRLDPKFTLAMAYLAVLTQGPQGLELAKAAEASAATLPPAERLTVRRLAAQRRGDQAAAGALLEQVAAMLPNDWRTQQQLALRAFGKRQWVAAEAGLRKAIALNPAAGEPYNQLAYALAFQRKFDDAVTAVKEYARRKPNEANAQDSLAEISLLAGRFDEAAKAFAEAGTLAPSMWIAWQGAGIAHALAGQWPSAQTAFMKAREAAKRLRDKLWIDIERSRAYVAEGKTGDAMRLLKSMEKAAEEGKEDVRFVWTPAHRAVALEAAGKHAEAVAHVDVALSRAEQKKVAPAQLRDLVLRGHAQRAWSLAALGRVADAEKSAAAAEAMAGKPEHKDNPFLQASALAARGAALLAKGDAKAAALHTKKCEPTHPACALVRVEALRKAGDTKGADAEVKALLDQPARDMTYVLARVRLAASARP